MIIQAILISLKITLFALCITMLFSILLTWLGSFKISFYKKKTDWLITLPMFFPPTAIGYLLLILLGKNGFIGSFLFKYFDTQLIFTWWSGVIAVSVVILPVVYQSVKTGFISLDKVYLEASRELGLTKMQTLIHVQLPLIKKNIASAMLLGFGRGIGEFGATIIVAGNLPGRTQTIPMAIYTAIEQGDNSSANMLLVTTIIISVIVILLYNFTIREEE